MDTNTPVIRRYTITAEIRQAAKYALHNNTREYEWDGICIHQIRRNTTECAGKICSEYSWLNMDKPSQKKTLEYAKTDELCFMTRVNIYMCNTAKIENENK